MKRLTERAERHNDGSSAFIFQVRLRAAGRLCVRYGGCVRLNRFNVTGKKAAPSVGKREGRSFTFNRAASRSARTGVYFFSHKVGTLAGSQPTREVCDCRHSYVLPLYVTSVPAV